MDAEMAKGSKKVTLWVLLFPLLCIVFIRFNPSSRNLWKIQAHWHADLNMKSEDSVGLDGQYHMKFLLRKLVRGPARKELDRNNATCIVEPRSTFCVTTSAVRITAGPPRSPTVYLTDGQVLSSGDTFAVKPYPRTTDAEAMQRTAPVNIVADEPAPPLCDMIHTVPAVVFSTGGFAGNFYHDISEVLMPLFLTAGLFRSQVQLVVTDYEPYWVTKYRRFLSRISDHDPVFSSSPYGEVAGGVHCFPAAVVGLKFHDHFLCNASRPPGGAGSLDFKRFLHESFSLKVSILAPTSERPRLLLLSRWRSRAILNQEDVISLANKVGFRVERAWAEMMANVEEFSELVNSCSVLMGVHGAGLTNMVFLPSGAVVLQIVPLGLEWQAGVYYGRRSAERFGLNYVEYKAAVEESSLYGKYPKDHPVLADPLSINRQGYSVSKPLYIDGQNVTIDLQRFRGALKQALAIIPHHPSS